MTLIMWGGLISSKFKIQITLLIQKSPMEISTVGEQMTNKTNDDYEQQ